jgi:hypothetical protein
MFIAAPRVFSVGILRTGDNEASDDGYCRPKK